MQQRLQQTGQTDVVKTDVNGNENVSTTNGQKIDCWGQKRGVKMDNSMKRTELKTYGGHEFWIKNLF